ncbi:MAG: restriction endonuclease subunit S [Prevotella copri]|nr:restriction endonuclease subunit S [Segatella copri]
MEWKEVDIEQTSIEIIDGDRGKNYPKNNELTNSGYCLFLSAANVTKNGLQFSNNSFITKEKDALLRKGKLMPQDIVLTTRGTVGNVGFYSDDVLYPNMRINSGMVIIRPGEDFDTMFLYQYLRSCYFRAQITQFQSGSAQPQLPISTLQKMKVIKPDIAAQRRIASILSSLDRKIELNNKINADLEEMAQAIFKNWFVDFEPFKDGKFVDSELGMIPEGWKVGRLGELCDFKRGKNLLTKNAIDEGVPVVAGGLEPSCYHNVANTGAPVITVSGSGANAGFMRMYHVPVWASDCSFIDISCENFYFVYCFLKVNSKLLKHAQTGAVQPHVKPSDIHDFELVIPDKESIYDFQDKVKPFFDKIASIQKENSRLSHLRDTLLPRLMSGKIEVLD